METLKISTTNKDHAIKLINQFRLLNKNKWYQIELDYTPYIYKFKIYGTWIQICRQIDSSTNKVLTTRDGQMDISVGRFKHTLNELIN